MILKSVLFSFLSTLVFAAEQTPAPSVKITRFYYSNNDSRSNVAELCGRTENVATLPAQVKVLSDEKRPYIVSTDREGVFCVTITTYYGTATAQLL